MTLFAILLALTGSRSASFTVTCTVVRHMRVGASDIAFAMPDPAVEPRVIGDTITF